MTGDRWTSCVLQVKRLRWEFVLTLKLCSTLILLLKLHQHEMHHLNKLKVRFLFQFLQQDDRSHRLKVTNVWVHQLCKCVCVCWVNYTEIVINLSATLCANMMYASICGSGVCLCACVFYLRFCLWPNKQQCLLDPRVSGGSLALWVCNSWEVSLCPQHFIW